jgi:hypothetical protein
VRDDSRRSADDPTSGRPGPPSGKKGLRHFAARQLPTRQRIVAA